MTNSAWVSVHDGGNRVYVLCAACGLHQRFEWIRDAQQHARQHNAAQHPSRIDWAS